MPGDFWNIITWPRWHHIHNFLFFVFFDGPYTFWDIISFIPLYYSTPVEQILFSLGRNWSSEAMSFAHSQCMMKPGLETSTTLHLFKYADDEFWLVQGHTVACLGFLHWASQSLAYVSLYFWLFALPKSSHVFLLHFSHCVDLIFTCLHICSTCKWGKHPPPRVEMHLCVSSQHTQAEWSRDERSVVECAEGESIGNLRVKDYYRIEGTGTTWWVSPGGLVCAQRRWYLRGWEEGRKDLIQAD